jgi:hypothetical protein
MVVLNVTGCLRVKPGQCGSFCHEPFPELAMLVGLQMQYVVARRIAQQGTPQEALVPGQVILNATVNSGKQFFELVLLCR